MSLTEKGNKTGADPSETPASASSGPHFFGNFLELGGPGLVPRLKSGHADPQATSLAAVPTGRIRLRFFEVLTA